MNKKIILMFLLPGAFFLMNPKCYDDDETRQQFTFNGTINNISTGWTISCTDNCSDCFGYPEGNNTNTSYLDKKLYPDVYRKCASLSGPLVNIDSLLNSGDGTTNNGRCSFGYPSSPYYGFDDVLDNSIDDVHYLSFAAKCSSNVEIFLDTSAYSTYKKVVAVLPSSALNNISFDKSVNKDTIQLKNAGSNNLTIYSLNDFANGETYELYVYGIYDPANPDCLAGDCNGAEDRLKVVVYNERVIDSLYVYAINNPSRNPAESEIKDSLNKYLRQAVVSIKGINKDTVATLKGDLNGNGCLDIFPNTDSVPVAWINEYYSIIDSVEREFNECASCQGSIQAPKVFLIPGAIQKDWLLMKDAAVGSDTIIVQYDTSFNSTDFLRNQNFSLSDWNGTNVETFTLNNVINDELLTDSKKNILAFKLYNSTLKFKHSKNSIFYKNSDISEIKGVTYAGVSCSILSTDLYNIETKKIIRHYMLHEFLHMAVIGPLSHTPGDTSNVMYPTTYKDHQQIRYRKLNTDNIYGLGSTESQWNILHNH